MDTPIYPARLETTWHGTKWNYYVNRFGEKDQIDGPLVIGYDTEYKVTTLKREAKEDGKKQKAKLPVGAQNQLLSYQFFVSSLNGTWKGIHYPTNRSRISLARFIGSVVAIGLKEKLIKKWPEEIYLCVHFALADIPAFKDVKALTKKVDSIRKAFVSLQKAVKITCYDESNHGHTVEVHFRDSLLLAPAGKQALKDLGETIGVHKMELAQGEIENMDRLLNEDRPRFEEYAIKDAEIAALYCMQMSRINLALLGKKKIPISLSSIGVSMLLQSWIKEGRDANEILGKEIISEKIYTGTHLIARDKLVPVSKCHIYELLVTECYQGARNEQYIYGAGIVGEWIDWDLCGAYTTAMALIGMPDWSGIKHSSEISDYHPCTLGFAIVEFEFPPYTRFPCLPVRTESGLLFPLKGESCCCAPEIYLAKQMGATLRILDGVIVPQDTKERPFASYIQAATKNRREHPKGSILELLWKEMANGTYGKTAQGLRDKRCYSSRQDKHNELPPSRITNPYFAAYVTSFVRAVLGEILNSLPESVSVCNATTDGFLCTATKNDVAESTEGELCQIYMDAREIITGKRECLEVKHAILQPLGMRTRGQATLISKEGCALVLAKAGIKVAMKDPLEQNEWIIKEFIERTVNTKFKLKTFQSMADICRNGGDLVELESDVSRRLDYDWKRRPINVTTRVIKNTPHIAFDTAPWQTAEEAIKCKEDWAAFVKATGRLLKTEDDLKAFEEYRVARKAVVGKKISSHGGILKITVRQFLRAFVRSEAGLDRNAMSYNEVAKMLRDFGIATTKSDVENAARAASVFSPYCIPRLPQTLELLAKIRGVFPTFEVDVLLERACF